MTHRERVLLALAHKEPDRIPIDLWGSASRICNKLYFEIVEHMGWKTLGPCIKVSRSGDYVDDRVSDMVGCDFRHINIGKPVGIKPSFTEKGELLSEWGWGTSDINGSSHVSYNPLADAEEGDISRHSWPKIENPGRIEGLKAQVDALYAENEFFISTASAVSGMMIDLGPSLRGFEQFLMDLYINESFAHKLIGKIADVIIELYSYFLKDVGPMIDCVEFSSDHGMQDRTLVAPEIYRKFFKEPYARVFHEVRKLAPNAKIFLHSCGSVRTLIPDFIDMGVDILNSLQPKAAGMDSFELKREFGSEIVFHGGLCLQGGITGTKEDAVKEVKKRIDAFAPQGGYIFGPSNHFMEDVSLDNFLAIYETASEYGKYPLKSNGKKTA
jgi:uroporphyrinogen decarboxylase